LPHPQNRAFPTPGSAYNYVQVSIMVTMHSIPPTSPAVLPLDNEVVAARLDETADLLAAKEVNPYRVRAYHVAAQTIRSLERPLHDLLAREGMKGLTELPGIGDSIGRTVERLLATGTFPQLERLRGRTQGDAVLATVPGLGPKSAARIRSVLGIETLADLEIAAYDGRLARLPGIGRKRLRAVRESLAGRFHHRPPAPEPARSQPVSQPEVAELLSIDEEYLRKAAEDRLLRVAPYRFNPSGTAWLPILRTHRGDRGYTALFSNSPRAHELGMTRDWVVIYSAGSGMPAGSQPLISLEQMDAGGGNLYDALVIGGDGPLGSEIVFDPFWNGELYSYADYVAGMGDFDPATGRGQDGNNHTVQAALGFGAYDVANVRLFGASTHPSNPGELQILVKGLATAFPAVDAMWKDGDVLRTGNGDMNISSGLIINAVPAEPAIAGKVWEWSGDITALTTYLAGGGRLAALGNP
jgi:putative hydrolase